jgi:hypothetical protein
MKIEKAVASVVGYCLSDPPYRKATKFISEDLVVTATRQHPPRKDDQSTSIVLTCGEPNYKCREFVKKCKKANVSFPIRKVQLELYK